MNFQLPGFILAKEHFNVSKLNWHQIAPPPPTANQIHDNGKTPDSDPYTPKAIKKMDNAAHLENGVFSNPGNISNFPFQFFNILAWSNF